MGEVFHRLAMAHASTGDYPRAIEIAGAGLGDVVLIGPPLIISEAAMETLVSLFDRSLGAIR